MAWAGATAASNNAATAGRRSFSDMLARQLARPGHALLDRLDEGAGLAVVLRELGDVGFHQHRIGGDFARALEQHRAALACARPGEHQLWGAVGSDRLTGSNDPRAQDDLLADASFNGGPPGSGNDILRGGLGPDVLSGGRIEWGTGRSTPMEQTAFGVDRDLSRDQWREAIEAVVGAWESEYFEFQGKHWDFPRRMVTPKPVQDPHPPCWMAATSDGSAEVAGSLGLGLLSFSILQPIERMAQHIAQYRAGAARAEPLTRVATNKVAAYTLVHCAETMEQCEANGIWDSVWWWYKNLAEFTLEWEFPHFTQAEKDNIFPLLQMQKEGGVPPQVFNDADMIVVGRRGRGGFATRRIRRTTSYAPEPKTFSSSYAGVTSS